MILKTLISTRNCIMNYADRFVLSMFSVYIHLCLFERMFFKYEYGRLLIVYFRVFDRLMSKVFDFKLNS